MHLIPFNYTSVPHRSDVHRPLPSVIKLHIPDASIWSTEKEVNYSVYCIQLYTATASRHTPTTDETRTFT